MLSATSVKPDILGSRLEAYINALDTVTTLRLCHRFGKGPQATISTLPVELVHLIEYQILREEQSATLESWQKDFKCFKQQCQPIDHFSKSDLEHWRKQVTLGAMFGLDDIYCAELKSDATLDEKVNHLAGGGDLNFWEEIHVDRCRSWDTRTGFKGVFVTHREVIKKHFGLDTWTAHIRLPNAGPDIFGDGLAKTTTAYLKLPEAQNVKRMWDMADPPEYDDDFDESGYGVPVAVPEPLSEVSFNRFWRAMFILDLKPHCYTHQKGMMLAADNVSRKKAKKQRLAWPQLTMLVNSVNAS